MHDCLWLPAKESAPIAVTLWSIQLSTSWEASSGTWEMTPQEAGMKQLDDNVGVVLVKLEQVGQLDNRIVHNGQWLWSHSVFPTAA